MGLFHIMHIGLFSLIDSAMVFLPHGYVPASVDLGGTLPFWLQRCNVSLHWLKAFQVNVPDTGNSQVKGEQLHKCSVGTKASSLFCQSFSDIWYITDMTKKSWKSVSNWIYTLWSYIVNVIQKNILRVLLLNPLGFSYKMLCCPVTQSNFLNILLLETVCTMATDHDLGIWVLSFFCCSFGKERDRLIYISAL